MRIKIFCIFVLIFMMKFAVAKDGAVDIAIDLDEKTQQVTLTLTNTSDSDIAIENSFGFTKEELEGEGRVEAVHAGSFAGFLYGVDVMVASEDMRLLSVSSMFPDGYIQNRIFSSRLLSHSSMRMKKGTNYVKKLHLRDILGGLENHVGFDTLNLSGSFVKVRLKVFLKEPIVQALQNETDWIHIE